MYIYIWGMCECENPVKSQSSSITLQPLCACHPSFTPSPPFPFPVPSVPLSSHFVAKCNVPVRGINTAVDSKAPSATLISGGRTIPLP